MLTSKFCRPILEANTLREAAAHLRSRHIKEQGLDISLSIASLIDHALQDPTSREIISYDSPEDEGKTLLFVQVESPTTHAQGHYLPVRERPLLIAVLLPDIAFQISELEATYGFSVNDILEIDPERQHYVLYRNCVFVDWVGTLMLLSQEQPTLAVVIASSFMLNNMEEGERLTEWLRGLIDTLGELPLLTPAQVYQQCMEILSQARSVVDINEEHSEFQRILYDTLDTILADEISAFMKLQEKLTMQDQDEEWEVRSLDRQGRHIRHMRRRMEALFEALRGE